MRYKQFYFIVIFSAFINVQVSAQNVDIDLLKKINLQTETAFKNNFFDATAKSVTIINIVAPVSILTAGLIKHDKQLIKDAAYMAGGFIMCTIVTQGMKKIIKRERPFNTYSFIINRDEGGSYSFPSGHTSSAFCTATSLSLLYPKWYVIAPAYLYAATVGYARMYQGVHYPSDVIVGAVVGAGSAWVSYKAEKWITKKQGQNKNVHSTSF